ncbi:hypothetical protein JYT87_01035 [Nitrospira defluvii]|nr:hypothetical protein [Nitrospira defluvii]
MSTEKERSDWGWIIPFIRNLYHDRFSGSIWISFHGGCISKKIEKTPIPKNELL